jgi:hypothetical protein
MMIRSERQTVVGKAQSSSDRCVPTVRPGDLGAIDVLDGSLKVQEAKGGIELTVVGEGHTVIAADPHSRKHRCPSTVETIREEFTHPLSLPATSS